MSGKYISLDAAIEAVIKCQKVYGFTDEGRKLTDVYDALVALPAADVVEVVRCYECIHHDEERPLHYCRRLRRDCPDDCEFYCAFGKRKEGGPDDV